jgi:hypothetical protein
VIAGVRAVIVVTVSQQCERREKNRPNFEEFESDQAIGYQV